MPRKKLTYTTKTQSLSIEIAKLARKMGPGAKLPTMQKLAEMFDISVMTINRALSELEAQGLLTRIQGSGTYVADSIAKHSVGLVYGAEGFAGPSPFRSLLLQRARERAASGDERFSLYLAEPSSYVTEESPSNSKSSPSGYPVHDDLVDAIQTRRLTGLLYAAGGDSPALKWLLEQKIPLVALGYRPVAPYRVRLNHAKTAELGVNALAAKGCKRIALWIPRGVGIGREEGEKSFDELDLFRAALKSNSLTYESKLVYGMSNVNTEVDPERPSDREQGLEIARSVFAESNKDSWPDGVVSLDDELTYGALVEFSRLSVRLGRDVQIATHSNKGADMLWGYTQDLTLIEFDPADVANEMFGLLETLMKGEEPARDVVAVNPKLV